MGAETTVTVFTFGAMSSFYHEYGKRIYTFYIMYSTGSQLQDETDEPQKMLLYPQATYLMANFNYY